MQTVSKMIRRLFKAPTAAEVAYREIEQSKQALLKHQAAADYHARMSEYCLASIRRLTGFIREEQK